MHTRRRLWIDFQQAKRVITVPDVLEACGVLDQFERTADDRLHGVCPLPEHAHGRYPTTRNSFRPGCETDCGCGTVSEIAGGAATAWSWPPR